MIIVSPGYPILKASPTPETGSRSVWIKIFRVNLVLAQFIGSAEPIQQADRVGLVGQRDILLWRLREVQWSAGALCDRVSLIRPLFVLSFVAQNSRWPRSVPVQL